MILENSGPRCMQVDVNNNNIKANFCNNLDGAGNGEDPSTMYFYFEGERLKVQSGGAGKCVQCGDPNDANSLDISLRDCLSPDDANIGYQQFFWWLPGDELP